MADLALLLTHLGSNVLPAIVSKLPLDCRCLGLALWTFFCDFHSLAWALQVGKCPLWEEREQLAALVGEQSGLTSAVLRDTVECRSQGGFRCENCGAQTCAAASDFEHGVMVTEELVWLREVQGAGLGTAECSLGFLSLPTLLRYPA